MTVLVGLLIAASVGLWRRGRRPRSRLARGRPSNPPEGRHWMLVLAVPAVAALALALFHVAGVRVLGWPAAAVAAVAIVLVARRRLLRRPRLSGIEVALALDLLGGALGSGCTPHAAAMAAATAAPPVAADALRTAATRLALGEDPAAVWALVAVTVPVFAEGARACARAAATGAAVADELHRVAAAARTASQIDRRRRLQRAAVWLVLPLGLCFLPAFVLVGVVPVVAGAIPSVLR